MPRVARVLIAGALALPVAATAFAAGEGKVSCEILENGKPASGTIEVVHGGQDVARGSCGKPISVPEGEHEAVLGLDGALDAPQQRKPLHVSAADKNLKLVADFDTGELEVKITSQGRDSAGMAVIRKDGKQIGTLGSGVAAHLSTGGYSVVARYRSQERRFDTVQIAKGQRTVLNATFE
jgi:hypothetical protein